MNGTPDFNLQIKVRNNKLLSRMRSQGIETAAELSRAASVGQSEIGKYLNLKAAPFLSDGSIATAAKKICDALFCDVEDIFPADYLYQAMDNNVAEVELTADQVAGLLGPNLDTIRQIEDADHLGKIMDCLTRRERLVIEHRFGLADKGELTLGETAKELAIKTESWEVTGQRIRQIEAKAFRKMRKAAIKLSGIDITSKESEHETV